MPRSAGVGAGAGLWGPGAGRGGAGARQRRERSAERRVGRCGVTEAPPVQSLRLQGGGVRPSPAAPRASPGLGYRPRACGDGEALPGHLPAPLGAAPEDLRSPLFCGFGYVNGAEGGRDTHHWI
ncbi:uncharacterized protein isoform X9 [Macaca fascicularis]|uniref:uncharacterized protein isoform X9 n=1 Tax=Macaca fascicularis TaxID=9541 RepID=UPI003D1563E2